MAERYDPERSLAELRYARNHGDWSFGEMYRILAEAAARAAEDLWPDPVVREAAGIGAVVAAATVAVVATPGRDAPILNAAAMFGLALVEHAREEANRAH